MLFVTWDGPQVSYLESLFLPFFRGLQAHGIDFDILQFRWGTSEQEEAVKAACEEAGCGYQAINVWRNGGAAGAFLTALTGAIAVRRAARRFGCDVLMPRSLMPALAILAARISLPVIFDADGLVADEKVEFAGLSPNAAAYHILRSIEAAMTRRSGAVIVRTRAAAHVLANRAGVAGERFYVVTNGRDVDAFFPLDEANRQRVRADLGIAADAPLLVYAGSVGPQYRFDLIATFTRAISDRLGGTRLLILTGQAEEAASELKRLAPELVSCSLIRRAPPDEVAALIAAADAGFAFRATSFSTRAISPVKLGEYLLCGLPVIGTAAIGDTAPAVEAGVLLDEGAGPNAAAEWFARQFGNRRAVAQRARDVGCEHFSLERSVSDYLELFRGSGIRPIDSSSTHS